MSVLGNIPSSDVSDIMDIRDGVYADKMFYYAICKLNILDLIKINKFDDVLIAKAFEFQIRPTQVMMDLMLCYELVSLENDIYHSDIYHSDIYHITKKSEEFLLKNSSRSLLPYLNTISDRFEYDEIEKLMRTGVTLSWPKKNLEGKSWEAKMNESKFSDDYTKGMDSRAKFYAPYISYFIDLSNHNTILDVAGGSGIYSNAIIEKNPHLKAYIIEKPPVDEIIRARINRYKLKKMKVIACDMFLDPYPKYADIHLYSHVLHDWGENEVITLLEKSYNSLPNGGVLIIYGSHFNGKNKTWLNVARYSVFIMSLTKGKCYGFHELKNFMENIGYSKISFIPTIGSRSIITAFKIT